MREVDGVKQLSVAESSAFQNKVLPLRERAQVRNRWLKQRLSQVLPMLMEREGLEMWVVTAREYNEDPVMMSLLPAEMLSARRRTILVYHRLSDGTVDCLSLSRPVPIMDQFYQASWPDNSIPQYDRLAQIIEERDPQTIGINVSNVFAFGDGLTHGEYQLLVESLGDKYIPCLRSAIGLCLGWLEYRTADEIAAYVGINEIAHGIIKEAFSSRVVLPGVTTALDVAWWIRQRIRDLGLVTWFMPSVSIQRQGCTKLEKSEIIKPGDILHCDVGIKYLGLCTDTQQNAYVLKLGEVDVPEGLKIALKEGNRLQDIHAEQMKTGRTGNEILDQSLKAAKQKGIVPCVYSHPIGFHGHGAGPTIGLYDQQNGVPGRGEYQLYDNTAYAMELNIHKEIPEWDNQTVRIALEQTIIYTASEVHFLSGRQTAWHLIR